MTYTPQYVQTWDGGTSAASGTQIAASNTNGTGNTAISSVVNNTGTTETFSNAWTHSGSLSVMHSYAANTAGYIVMPVTAAVGARLGLREYFSFPASSINVAKRLYEFRDTASVMAGNVYINSSNFLGIVDATGAAPWTSTVPIPHDGSTVRVEVIFKVGTTSTNGAWRVLAFVGNSTTPFIDSGETTTGKTGTTALGTVRLGSSAQATVAYTYYRDDFAADTTLTGTNLIGPTGATNPVSIISSSAALNVALSSTSAQYIETAYTQATALSDDFTGTGGGWSTANWSTDTGYSSQGSGVGTITTAATGYSFIGGVANASAIDDLVLSIRPTSGSTSVEQYSFLCLRAAGANPYDTGATAYTMQINWSSGQLQINRRVNSINTLLVSSATGLYSPGVLTRFRFQYRDGYLRAKAWVDGTAEPAAWAISVFDQSPLAPGLASMYVMNGGDAVARSYTVDTARGYSITDSTGTTGAPALGYTLGSTSAVVLPSGASVALGYALSSTASSRVPVSTTGSMGLGYALGSTVSSKINPLGAAASLAINLTGVSSAVASTTAQMAVNLGVTVAALTDDFAHGDLGLNLQLLGQAQSAPAKVGLNVAIASSAYSHSVTAGGVGLVYTLSASAFTAPGPNPSVLKLNYRLSDQTISYITPGSLIPFTITVYDKSFKRLQQIGDPVFATFVPRWPGLGSAEIQLRIDDTANEWLQTPGARITCYYRGELLFSGPVTRFQGSLVDSELVTYEFSDDYTAVADTLAWPVPTADLSASSTSDLAQGGGAGDGYYHFPNPIAETAIKGVVGANFTRLNRPVTIAPDLGRGGDATANLGTTIRFDPLDTVVEPIAVGAGLRPVIRQLGSTLTFDTIPTVTWPQHLTYESGVLQDGNYSVQAPATTRVVIGGPGQDAARAFAGGADTQAESLWGRQIETFKDATSNAAENWPDSYTDAQKIDRYFPVDTGIPQADRDAFTTALTTALNEALAAGRETSGANVTLAETQGFHYGGVDGFHVGDTVTVDTGGVLINDLITECTLAWAVDSFTVTPAVGDRSNDPDIQLLTAVQLIAARLRTQATGR